MNIPLMKDRANMDGISFIFTSFRSLDVVNRRIQNIRDISKQKKYEIIFLSEMEYDLKDAADFKYIKTNYTGSVKNFNHGIKNSKYEWIAIVCDDFQITSSLLYEIPDKLKLLPFPNNSICNIHYNQVYSTDTKAIFIPFVKRKFIEEELDGVIFNNNFHHHYVDRWLFEFLNFKFKNFKCETHGCVRDVDSKCNRSYDTVDENFFNFLYENIDTIPYNKHVNE